jgi:tripartite-type tricarboxylate transporter receptor subunit TctC
MNFGTAGLLTTNDMGPRELFRLLKLAPDQAPTMIPYKGTGDTVQSLLAGETDFSCGSMGPFLGHLKAGTLRALMITTAERMPSLPDVPTARELGYADMERIVGWSAIFGPAKLPADVRDRLVAVMKTIATDPAWHGRHRADGLAALREVARRDTRLPAGSVPAVPHAG